MKIVIPGGSGQIGKVLARAFLRDGHDVTVLSRNPRDSAVPTRVWDGAGLGPWAQALEGVDVVVNLAGRSVNCRYGTRNRRSIMDSRIDSTRVLGEAIAQCQDPPTIWLQASTATIYEHRFDAPNDEEDGIIGGNEPGAPDTWRFSIDVAASWERAFERAAVPSTRKIALRSAIVMSPDRGGAFDILLGLVRRGLGGRYGDGRQYVSWVHDADFVRALYWIVDHPDLPSPINIASPKPLPNADFMRELRQAWGISVGLPAARWMLEIGAFFLRTETELVLKSRRVVPKRLTDSGFTFNFPTWRQAAEDLCRRWRQMSGTRSKDAKRRWGGRR